MLRRLNIMYGEDASRISWRQWYQYKFNRSTLRVAMEAINALMSLASVSVYISNTYVSLSRVTRLTYFLCSITFSVEYIARLLAAPDILRYLFWDWSLVDMATIVYGFAYLATDISNSLGYIRLMRIFQVVRLCKAVTSIVLQYSRRTSQPMQLEIVRRRADVAVTLVAVVFISACVFYELEIGTQELQLHEAIYWACVTISTVGYGDYSPATVAGQLLFPVLFLIIIMILPQKISNLSDVLQTYSRFTRRSHRSPGLGQHVVLTGHVTPVSAHTFISEFFHKGRGYQAMDVVVLYPEDPAPELVITMNNPRWEKRVRYLNGSPFHAEDLSRADTGRALAVFVLSNKYAADPAAEDSRTLLAVLAVAQFLRQFAGPGDLPPPRVVSWSATSWKGRHSMAFSPSHPHIIAQFLLNETLDNAMALLQSGAAHPPEMGLLPLSVNPFPICVGALRASLLGASLHTPGLITLVTNLCISCCLERKRGLAKETVSMLTGCGWLSEYLAGAAVEIYDVTFPKPYWGCSFKQAALHLWRNEGVILIGVRFPKHEDPQEWFDVKLAPLSDWQQGASAEAADGKPAGADGYAGGGGAASMGLGHWLIDEDTVGYILSTDALVLGSAEQEFRGPEHHQALKPGGSGREKSSTSGRAANGGGGTTGCMGDGATTAPQDPPRSPPPPPQPPHPQPLQPPLSPQLSRHDDNSDSATATTAGAAAAAAAAGGAPPSPFPPSIPSEALTARPATCLPYLRVHTAPAWSFAVAAAAAGPPPSPREANPWPQAVTAVTVEGQEESGAVPAVAGTGPGAAEAAGGDEGGAWDVAASGELRDTRWRRLATAAPPPLLPTTSRGPPPSGPVSGEEPRGAVRHGGHWLFHQPAVLAKLFTSTVIARTSAAPAAITATATGPSVDNGDTSPAAAATAGSGGLHALDFKSRASFPGRTTLDRFSANLKVLPAATTATSAAANARRLGRPVTHGRSFLLRVHMRSILNPRAAAAATTAGNAATDTSTTTTATTTTANLATSSTGFTSTRRQQGLKAATKAPDLHALAALSSFTYRWAVKKRTSRESSVARMESMARSSRMGAGSAGGGGGGGEAGGDGGGRGGPGAGEGGTRAEEQGASQRRLKSMFSEQVPVLPQVVTTFRGAEPLESPVIIAGSSCFAQLEHLVAAVRSAPPVGAARRFRTCPIVILDNSEPTALSDNQREALAWVPDWRPESIWILRAGLTEPRDIEKLNLRTGGQVDALIVPSSAQFAEEEVAGSCPALADGQVLLGANALRRYCEEMGCELRVVTEMLALLNCSYALPLCLAEGPYTMRNRGFPDTPMRSTYPPTDPPGHPAGQPRELRFVTDPRPSVGRRLKLAARRLHQSDQARQEEFLQYLLTRMPHLTPALAPGHILMQPCMDALACQTIFNPMMLQILLKFINCWEGSSGQQLAQQQHHQQRHHQVKQQQLQKLVSRQSRGATVVVAADGAGRPRRVSAVQPPTTTLYQPPPPLVLPLQLNLQLQGQEQRQDQREGGVPVVNVIVDGRVPSYAAVATSDMWRRGSGPVGQLGPNTAPSLVNSTWVDAALTRASTANGCQAAPTTSPESTEACAVTAVVLQPSNLVTERIWPLAMLPEDSSVRAPLLEAAQSTGYRSARAAAGLGLAAALPLATEPIEAVVTAHAPPAVETERVATPSDTPAVTAAAPVLPSPALSRFQREAMVPPSQSFPSPFMTSQGGRWDAQASQLPVAGAGEAPAAASTGAGVRRTCATGENTLGSSSDGGRRRRGSSCSVQSSDTVADSTTVRVFCLNFGHLRERLPGFDERLRAVQHRLRHAAILSHTPPGPLGTGLHHHLPHHGKFPDPDQDPLPDGLYEPPYDADVAERGLNGDSGAGDGPAAAVATGFRRGLHASELVDGRELRVSPAAPKGGPAATFGALFEVLVTDYDMMPLALYRRDAGENVWRGSERGRHRGKHSEQKRQEVPQQRKGGDRWSGKEGTGRPGGVWERAAALVRGLFSSGRVSLGERGADSGIDEVEEEEELELPSRNGVPEPHASGMPYVYTKPSRDATWLRQSDDVYVLTCQTVVTRLLGEGA